METPVCVECCMCPRQGIDRVSNKIKVTQYCIESRIEKITIALSTYTIRYTTYIYGTLYCTILWSVTVRTSDLR